MTNQQLTKQIKKVQESLGLKTQAKAINHIISNWTAFDPSVVEAVKNLKKVQLNRALKSKS